MGIYKKNSKMRYVQFSEKGPRMNNEDCCNVVEIADDRVLFVVCDGMGGHSHGEVASKTVCDSFTNYWLEHPDVADSEGKIMDAAKAASQAIDEKSGNFEMGTTLVMASIEGKTAHIAHAGDSRCYVVGIKGNVKYRTIDHIDSRFRISRAFFTQYPEKAIPEVKTVNLQPLDRILLCTDGLYNAIDDETLLHTLHCAKDVDGVAERFRAICREKADDNYTAIIAEVE